MGAINELIENNSTINGKSSVLVDVRGNKQLVKCGPCLGGLLKAPCDFIGGCAHVVKVWPEVSCSVTKGGVVLCAMVCE